MVGRNPILCYNIIFCTQTHTYSINLVTLSSVFVDDMAEKNLRDITIHDVDPLALTLLVDFSYTGELSVCEDNVQVDRSDSVTV